MAGTFFAVLLTIGLISTVFGFSLYFVLRNNKNLVSRTKRVKKVQQNQMGVPVGISRSQNRHEYLGGDFANDSTLIRKQNPT